LSDAEKDVCSKRYPALDEMMQVGSKHAVFRRRMQGLQDGIGGLLSGGDCSLQSQNRGWGARRNWLAGVIESSRPAAENIVRIPQNLGSQLVVLLHHLNRQNTQPTL